MADEIALAVIALWLGGCGVTGTTPAAPEPTPEAQAVAPVPTPLTPVAPEERVTGAAVDAFLDLLLLQSLAGTGGALPGLGPGAAFPTGPLLDDTMTFLERLCIAEGEPDFECRQRYGL